MPTNKIILGFTGQMACGKGTVAAYLEEKHGASTYRFSTMLRDVLDRLYLEHTRDHMQTLSQILREHFGEDTMARVMARDVESDPHQLIVVEGIRRPDDIVYLGTIPGFVLVSIEADMQVRYNRIIARGENSDDTTKTLEQFEQDHEREPEQKIATIMKEASETINNDGSLEELYAQLDALVHKYASSN